ncbi:MAG TPA: DivIVA domain-containing protein [Actinomycetota bacterium]|nr:DivIVA domain-containing protein [Actinomycetota bacterium]
MAIPEPERHTPRPSDIAGRGFSLGRKGYDPEEVHEFLTQVAEHVSRLQGEVEWLRARSEHLERRTAAAQEAAYARVSRDFMEVVRRADEAAGRVRLQAETKAQADIMLARKDAERILSEAGREAERILAAARLEAHEIDWHSKRQEARPGQHPQAEWPDPPDPPGVDIPTAAVDIAAIWDRDDAESRQERERVSPKPFEELSSPAIHIPDAWMAGGHVPNRDASHEDLTCNDPEDLDVYLDVPIFDLFENHED